MTRSRRACAALLVVTLMWMTRAFAVVGGFGLI